MEPSVCATSAKGSWLRLGGSAKPSRRHAPRRLREGFAKAPRAPSFGNDSSDNDKPPEARRENEKPLGKRQRKWVAAKTN